MVTRSCKASILIGSTTVQSVDPLCVKCTANKDEQPTAHERPVEHGKYRLRRFCFGLNNRRVYRQVKLNPMIGTNWPLDSVPRPRSRRHTYTCTTGRGTSRTCVLCHVNNLNRVINVQICGTIPLFNSREICLRESSSLACQNPQ